MLQCVTALTDQLDPANARRVSVLQCVAVCCGVLQCVAVCCGVLQCVAVCYGPCKSAQLRECSQGECVLQCVAVCCSVLQRVAVFWRITEEDILVHIMQCVAVCCSVLQGVAVCCGVSQCCSVLQCVRDLVKKKSWLTSCSGFRVVQCVAV